MNFAVIAVKMAVIAMKLGVNDRVLVVIGAVITLQSTLH